MLTNLERRLNHFPSLKIFFYLTANWKRRRDDRLIIVLTSERHFQETAKRRNQRLTQSPRAWRSLHPHLLSFFVSASRLKLVGHYSCELHTKQAVGLFLLLLIPTQNALQLVALVAEFTNRRLIQPPNLLFYYYYYYY